MSGLAVLGATPRITGSLPLLRARLPGEPAVSEVLDTLRSTSIHTNNGPYVEELEARVAARLGVRYVVAVSSGTAALQIVIRALGLTGSVVLPSFTFVSTAQALIWNGLRPVFCDIEPDSFCLDPDAVAKSIRSDTSAVMGVNLFGNSCRIDELSALCENADLSLFFDSAQAFGSQYKGEPIGRFGVAETFSLHATKILSSLEGGLVATNRADICESARLLRNFGFAGYDHVVALGFNAKLNEFCAGLGVAALEEVDARIASNVQVHTTYEGHLARTTHIRRYLPPPMRVCNFHSYPILIEEGFPIKRDQLCDIFWRENILTRRYYFPGCHRMSLFRTFEEVHLPVTDSVSERILCLPCFPEMTHDEVGIVCDVLEEVMQSGDELRDYYKTHDVDSRLLQAYEQQ